MELVFSADTVKGWISKALKNIFGSKSQSTIEPNIFEAESASIVDAVETGLGIKYNSPNFEFGLKLRESGLWFAARKTWPHCWTMVAAPNDPGQSLKNWQNLW